MSTIFSSRSLFFFSTELLLKIPVFQLNNRFIFHGAWAVDIQSIVELLQLTYDFLTSVKKVITFVQKLLFVRTKMCLSGLLVIAHYISFSIEDNRQIRFPCSRGYCGHHCKAHKSDCMFSKLQTETSLCAHL